MLKSGPTAEKLRRLRAVARPLGLSYFGVLVAAMKQATALYKVLPLAVSLLAPTVSHAAAIADTPPDTGIKVLVLDFGLRDETMLPKVPLEVKRNASLAPFLRARLSQIGIHVMPFVTSPELKVRLESGYLLAHPNLLADLGKAQGADWVIVGSQFKFSFLISSLSVQLIDSTSGLIVARTENALRGSMDDERMTSRTINSLAEDVNNILRELEQRKNARVSAEH